MPSRRRQVAAVGSQRRRCDIDHTFRTRRRHGRLRHEEVEEGLGSVRVGGVLQYPDTAPVPMSGLVRGTNFSGAPSLMREDELSTCDRTLI